MHKSKIGNAFNNTSFVQNPIYSNLLGNIQQSEKIAAADRPHIPQFSLLALVSGMILHILPKRKLFVMFISFLYHYFFAL